MKSRETAKFIVLEKFPLYSRWLHGINIILQGTDPGISPAGLRGAGLRNFKLDLSYNLYVTMLMTHAYVTVSAKTLHVSVQTLAYFSKF